jgi:raffinose/stachyose/melibiose transport system permease protein
MKARKFIRDYWLDVIAFVVVGIIFIVPFLFILLMAAKTRQEAALFEFNLPAQVMIFQNMVEVIKFRDYRMGRALLNSSLVTVGSVTLIVRLLHWLPM